MYPSSSSSTSHGSMGPSGLTRYGSAPGSLLATTVDSVINGRSTELSAAPSIHMGLAGTSRFFPSETSSQSSEPKSAANNNNGAGGDHHRKGGGTGGGADGGGLQRSYRLNEFATAFGDLRSRTGGGAPPSSSSPTALVRHSSSPAGFLNALTPASDNAFSMARGIGSYKSKSGGENGGSSISRLSSQLSFTRDSLSHISEENESIDVNDIVSDGSRNAYGHAPPANTTFGHGSWDESNSIIFSAPHSKRPKLDGLNIVESELHFGLSQSALEAATMEKLIEIPHDSVPCKIRAKRGCATHPRSIAERERRTRISGKLKKLQDLVPNMDKQTSYADMLDLAVQHIKGLQSQVQKLNKELQNCTCGCKQNSS